MLFTSWEFLLFLAVLFSVYYIIPKSFQWMLLLAANAFFYAFAGWYGFVYISVTICSTYLIAIRIERVRGRRERDSLEQDGPEKERKREYKLKTKRQTRKWMVLCLAVNFGLLAALKFSDSFISLLRPLFSVLGMPSGFALLLPMGISFYMFQTMGYLIDVYHGKYQAERNIFRFALFVSFFPLLVQGPISRFNQLSATLFKRHDFDAKQVSFGLQRIVWGYFKKVVIADRISLAVSSLIKDPNSYKGAYVVCLMAFYALELYADFTGGIDITIGIAQALGITVQENFLRPYFSKNIAEYWRRWHISLLSWFREYLYYPLAASGPMLKLSRKARAKLGNGIGKRLPVYVSTLVVWMVTGLWHGDTLNFIVWGLMNGVIILVSMEFSPLYLKFHRRFPRLKGRFEYRLFMVLRTFFLLSALRLLDCYRNAGLAFRMFFSIFTNRNWGELFGGTLLNLGLTASDYIVAGLGAALLISVSLIQRRGSVREKLRGQPYPLRYGIMIALLVAVLVLGAYGMGYNAKQFIYGQF